jgi:pyrimidine-nucleoside phosphorylase
MHIPTLIERKRDGHELSPNEIGALIDGFMRGEIPDYQMNAFAMAVFFRGMTPNETQHLTAAMMKSGLVLRYPDGSPAKVDKHSAAGKNTFLHDRPNRRICPADKKLYALRDVTGTVPSQR